MMKEMSKLLGAHIRTIQKWDKQDKIRCVKKIGGRLQETEIKKIFVIHEERKIVGYRGCRKRHRPIPR